MVVVARALDLVQARGAAAQLCVVREGQVVLDRGFGCSPHALFWTFSASKPFVALLVHLLAQRGELTLDDRVAEHWPRFGRHGKESVTIRQVLQHRSGLPVARGAARDALAMTDWDRAVRQVEQRALLVVARLLQVGLDEAIEIAKECPALKYGVDVEVRPIIDQCSSMQRVISERLARATV